MQLNKVTNTMHCTLLAVIATLTMSREITNLSFAVLLPSPYRDLMIVKLESNLEVFKMYLRTQK